jgi:hypothetical protein
MSCGCGTHLVQELELEQTMHSLTIQERDAARAQVAELRAAAASRAGARIRRLAMRSLDAWLRRRARRQADR